MNIFKRKKPDLSHIPGDMGLPYFGYAFEFLKDAKCIIERKKAQYGEIYRSRFLGIDGVTLLGKTANKYMLVDNKEHFSSKEGWENIIAELFPNSLIHMDGTRHQHHRSILNTAFKKVPMHGYMEIMHPIIGDYFNNFSINNTQTKLYPRFKALTLQIAGRVFFGMNFSGELAYINDSIIRVLKASMAVPLNLPFTTYGKGIRARKKLETYFQSIIQEKRANPEKDLFSVLCEAKNEEGAFFSDQEIIDHLISILMAGHDTTASAITSLAYLLAKHPSWQEKLREEAASFTETHKTGFSITDLGKLSLLSLAIKESLRLYPPVLMVPRVASKAFDYQGYTVPEKTMINVVLHHHHQNTDIWDHPDTFDPMRFSRERKEHQRCPYTYLPFGAGKHYCLGFSFAEMELKLIMLQMLKHIKWSVPQDYVIRMNQVPVQEPSDGLPVLIERLNS